MKKIQLAKLYRGSRFYGYGLAVDGELLHNQIGNIIETNAHKLPVIKIDFYLDDETISNSVVIELPR